MFLNMCFSLISELKSFYWQLILLLLLNYWLLNSGTACLLAEINPANKQSQVPIFSSKWSTSYKLRAPARRLFPLNHLVHKLSLTFTDKSVYKSFVTFTVKPCGPNSYCLNFKFSKNIPIIKSLYRLLPYKLSWSAEHYGYCIFLNFAIKNLT
jgi:hypothetical protein